MNELVKSESSNTLNSEKEYNILFSDLFGTLLREKAGMTMEDVKKEILKISPILNKYLSGNNFLVIISSADHSFPDTLVEIFETISNSVLPEYKDKIIYFMSNILKNELISKKYGRGTSTNIRGLYVGFIEDKSEAVDITLKKLKGYKIKDIGAIGDTYKEFGLLNEVHNLGGYTGIIGGSYVTRCKIKYLLFDDNSASNIISKIAELECWIRSGALIKDFIDKRVESGIKMTIIDEIRNIANSQELKNIREQKDNRVKELNELFENGDISIEELKRILYLDCIADDQLFISYMSEELSAQKAEEVLTQTYIIGENFSENPVSENKQLLKTGADIKRICGKTDN